MDRKRLLELSGQLDGWTEEPVKEEEVEVLDEMHLGMSHVKPLKKDNKMDMTHHKAGHKSDDKEPKATHEKKTGGDVVKKDNKMDKVHHNAGHKSDDKEPKATHEKKVGGDVVKEMAQAIVESGDVEGTLRELIGALREAGIDL